MSENMAALGGMDATPRQRGSARVPTETHRSRASAPRCQIGPLRSHRISVLV